MRPPSPRFLPPGRTRPPRPTIAIGAVLSLDLHARHVGILVGYVGHFSWSVFCDELPGDFCLQFSRPFVVA